MKYFSSTQVSSIHTYTVNGGEYESSIDIDQVLQKFSKCLNCPLADVKLYFANLCDPAAIVKAGKVAELERASARFSPNEESRIRELFEFYTLVVSSLMKDGWGEDSRVFLVCDLNTGATFTWIHSVC